MKFQGRKNSGLSSQFDLFIKTTAVNVCKTVIRTYLREKRREEKLVITLEDLDSIMVSNPVPDFEKEEVKLGSSVILIENENLAKALRKLKESYQVILEYSVLKDKPNKAIAELMELEEKTIRNYKAEALSILRKHMTEDPEK